VADEIGGDIGQSLLGLRLRLILADCDKQINKIGVIPDGSSRCRGTADRVDF
jgi:hypothetical protein